MIRDSNDDAIEPRVFHRINCAKYDNINIKYWNANSIRNKLYTIENEVNLRSDKTTHIIAITETRIFDHQTEFYNLPNYNSYFICRKDGYGGVCLYIHESIDSNLIESSEEAKINYVIVNVPAIRSSVAVVYKKPSVSFSVLATVLTKILTKTNRIILVGDININIQNDNIQTSQYRTLIQSLGCFILNSSNKKYATRVNKHINARHTLSSTIDHIITNNLNFTFNISVNDSHVSDHKQLFLSFHDNSNSLTKFAQVTTSFTKKTLNLEHFKRILSREINVYKPDNFSSLLYLISNAKNRCILMCTYNFKYNPHKRWVNDELSNLIEERNRYHKLMRRHPHNTYVKQKYDEHCKHVCSLNNRLRRNHNSKNLNKCLHKPRLLWKCFNEIIHNKPYSTN